MSESRWVLVAAGLSFAVSWLLVPPWRTAEQRLAFAPRLPPRGLAAGIPSHRAKLISLVVVGVVTWGLLRGLDGRLVVLGLGALGVLWTAQRLTASWRVRTAQIHGRAAVVELCDALAAELEAGLPAVTAIERACAPWPGFAEVANSARLGDDVAEALRRAAEASPGGRGLRAVAAAWDVACRSGVALAVVLARVGAGLRSDEEARAEVAAALGPPRATAKLLAVLPLFGIALGMSMGADPLGFLLRTAVGLGCLTGGIGLALAGVWWVERLASAAEA